MARPKLPGGLKRSARVMTALLPSELERLERMITEKGKTASDLLREALLKDPAFRKTDRRRTRRQ